MIGDWKVNNFESSPLILLALSINTIQPSNKHIFHTFQIYHVNYLSPSRSRQQRRWKRSAANCVFNFKSTSQPNTQYTIMHEAVAVEAHINCLEPYHDSLLSVAQSLIINTWKEWGAKRVNLFNNELCVQ
jgi:hypothetical protein